MDSLLQGLGFGLAFWLVTIPVCLLIRDPKAKEDRKSFDEELKGFWIRQCGTLEKQVATLMAIHQAIENHQECADGMPRTVTPGRWRNLSNPLVIHRVLIACLAPVRILTVMFGMNDAMKRDWRGRVHYWLNSMELKHGEKPVIGKAILWMWGQWQRLL